MDSYNLVEQLNSKNFEYHLDGQSHPFNQIIYLITSFK